MIILLYSIEEISEKILIVFMRLRLPIQLFKNRFIIIGDMNFLHHYNVK